MRETPRHIAKARCVGFGPDSGISATGAVCYTRKISRTHIRSRYAQQGAAEMVVVVVLLRRKQVVAGIARLGLAIKYNGHLGIS